ncbi:hypothetical protein EWM64_g6619 [Hericium alpestre]|uniref:Uncharacterized protein n=1 Tax=Hericium alpestre TaxID=135208 RepID=A0A4Y9ZT16_9AGAM|nr:hypothetical protein EWM64_g6619 [Hericium alpestre]
MSTVPQPNQRPARPPPSQPRSDQMDATGSPACHHEEVLKAFIKIMASILQAKYRAAARADGEMGPQRGELTTDMTASISAPIADNDIVAQLTGLINRAWQLTHGMDTEIAIRMALEGKLTMTQRQVAEAAERIQAELLKAKDLESKHTTQTLDLQTRIQELIASNAAKEETIKSQASKIESMETYAQKRPTQLSDLEMRVQESAVRLVVMQDMIKLQAEKINVLETKVGWRQGSSSGLNWAGILDFILCQGANEWLFAESPVLKLTIEIFLILGLFVLPTPAGQKGL